MTERERVIRICRELVLPDGQWMINGSGSMIMHGITAEERGKSMGDLDLFVATRVWFDMYETRSKPDPANSLMAPWPRDWKLVTTFPDDPKRRVDPPYLTRVMHGLRVDVFFQWRVRHVGDFDVAFYMLNTEVVDGVQCVPLQFILDWKREVGRAKDVQDVRLLEELLEPKAI